MAAVSVRQIRQKAGLSQRELAALSGVAQPNIAAYESGARTPSEKMLARMIAAAKPRPSLALAVHRDAVKVIAAERRAVDVRVFGSVARGEDAPGSDLDLLVSFSREASLYDQLKLKEDLERLLGVRVDVVSVAGLTARHSRILREAKPL